MPYKDPEARRRNSKEYLAKNREARQAYDKAYYLEHRERKLAARKERYSPEDAKAYRIKNHESVAATLKKSYVNNRASRLAKNKEYRIKNREVLNVKLRERRAKDRERWRTYCKEWNKKNPDKATAIQHKKRAGRLACNGTYAATDIQLIWKRQNGICANPRCGAKLSRSNRDTYHIDHIAPLSRGGDNTKHNLQLLCPKCNYAKKDKDEYEWANKHGLLFVK